MEASALELRCSDGVNDWADNSVEGVTGHGKDDPGMAGSQLPEQYEASPPGAATGTAAILQSVVRILGRLVDLLANESVRTNQAMAGNLPANKGKETDVKDGAVDKNDGD